MCVCVCVCVCVSVSEFVFVFLDIVNLSFPDLRVDHSHWTFNLMPIS